jgi:hypothetical protein
MFLAKYRVLRIPRVAMYSVLRTYFKVHHVAPIYFPITTPRGFELARLSSQRHIVL